MFSEQTLSRSTEWAPQEGMGDGGDTPHLATLVPLKWGRGSFFFCVGDSLLT